MGCKDRDADEQMRKAIAIRSAIKESKDSEVIVEKRWDGSILDVQLYVMDLSKVISITRLSEGVYVAAVLEAV